MNWQPIATAVIVGLAVFYLVWKLGFSRRSRRPSKGPDVKLSALTRKRK